MMSCCSRSCSGTLQDMPLPLTIGQPSFICRVMRGLIGCCGMYGHPVFHNRQHHLQQELSQALRTLLQVIVFSSTDARAIPELELHGRLRQDDAILQIAA